MPATSAEALEFAQRDALFARRVFVSGSRPDGGASGSKAKRRASMGTAGATPSIKKKERRASL